MQATLTGRRKTAVGRKYTSQDSEHDSWHKIESRCLAEAWETRIHGVIVPWRQHSAGGQQVRLERRHLLEALERQHVQRISRMTSQSYTCFVYKQVRAANVKVSSLHVVDDGVIYFKYLHEEVSRINQTVKLPQSLQYMWQLHCVPYLDAQSVRPETFTVCRFPEGFSGAGSARFQPPRMSATHRSD